MDLRIAVRAGAGGAVGNHVLDAPDRLLTRLIRGAPRAGNGIRLGSLAGISYPLPARSPPETSSPPPRSRTSIWRALPGGQVPQAPAIEVARPEPK